VLRPNCRSTHCSSQPHLVVTPRTQSSHRLNPPSLDPQEALLSTITDFIALHEEKFGPHDRNLTISVRGHSLGGALAVLSAFDIVESNYNSYKDGTRVKVQAISFEAPRVGNPAFVSRFEE
jgi:predicted lipase